MIKFFRHIRKSLLNEGKTKTYLLYAIGEIILVVIGILIALQINNWNENNIKKSKEKTVLIEIISDLNENISNAKDDISVGTIFSRDSIMSSFPFVINHLKTNKPYNDKLGLHFLSIHQSFGLEYKTSGYESLKSIGIDLISDVDLRSKIGKYYTFRIEQNKTSYKELRDDFYSYLLGFSRKYFKIETTNGKLIQVPHDYEALCKNLEYIESLNLYSYIYSENLISTKSFLKTSYTLKKDIENYLNKE